MSNSLTNYICTNPGCEDFYETTGVEITQEQVVSNATSEICCPKCGIELTPHEYYMDEKKKIKDKKRKKLILIIIAILGVAIIATAVVLLIGGGNKSNKEKEVVKTTPQVTIPVKPEATVEAEEPKVEPKTERVVKEPETPKPPKGNQTKNFLGGSKYVGEMKNGKMHGLGTFYYGQRELISAKDLKKRYAESGDYLIGEFYEGNVVSGKLYDSSNSMKEVIIIGR